MTQYRTVKVVPTAAEEEEEEAAAVFCCLPPRKWGHYLPPPPALAALTPSALEKNLSAFHVRVCVCVGYPLITNSKLREMFDWTLIRGCVREEGWRGGGESHDDGKDWKFTPFHAANPDTRAEESQLSLARRCSLA